MAFKDTLAQTIVPISDLYYIVLADGTEYHYTTHDYAIVFPYDGQTYEPLAALERTSNTEDTDFTVGEIKVTLPAISILFNFSQIINETILDNAQVTIFQVDRENTSNWRRIFSGLVSTVSIDNHVIELSLRNKWNAFLRRIPKRIYSEACPYKFGDENCKLDLETLRVDVLADVVSDRVTLYDFSVLDPFEDNYFRGGYIEATTGAYTGTRRPIASSAEDRVDLLRPFPVEMDGMQFKVYPHCEKSFEKCSTFLNTDNFGAFQYIPKPEEALL